MPNLKVQYAALPSHKKNGPCE